MKKAKAKKAAAKAEAKKKAKAAAAAKKEVNEEEDGKLDLFSQVRKNKNNFNRGNFNFLVNNRNYVINKNVDNAQLWLLQVRNCFR